MKTLLVLASLTFSVSALACPNISGSFYDDENETTVTITQDKCVSTTWSDADGKVLMLADGVERVLEKEGDMTAYAKVSFTDEDFIVDIRMDYAGHNDMDLPDQWITSYRIDKYNNLVEKIRPFKTDGTELSTDYKTLRVAK
jgi:hypothetical protein